MNKPVNPTHNRPQVPHGGSGTPALPHGSSGTAPPKQSSQAEHDKALLDEIMSRKAVYTPFQESAPITLTVGMVLKYFARPTKKGNTCPEWQAERFIALCKSRGLNPFVGDAYIVGYDADDGPEFSLITAHQALLKRAEMHSAYRGMMSGIVARRTTVSTEGEEVSETVEYPGKLLEPGDALIGGWAQVFRNDRDHPTYTRLKLDAYSKGFGRWKHDAAGMIVKCAQGGSLREAFPNTLGGMYTEEESISLKDAGLDAPPSPLERVREKVQDMTARVQAQQIPPPAPIREREPGEDDDEAGPTGTEAAAALGGGTTREQDRPEKR